MKKQIVLIFTLGVVLSCSYQKKNNQTTQHEEVHFLDGLKLANDDEMEIKLMLDGNSIPIYNEEGNKLGKIKIMKMMMTGDYLPQPYVNDSMEVKLVVMKKATEDEKQKVNITIN